MQNKAEDQPAWLQLAAGAWGLAELGNYFRVRKQIPYDMGPLTDTRWVHLTVTVHVNKAYLTHRYSNCEYIVPHRLIGIASGNKMHFTGTLFLSCS